MTPSVNQAVLTHIVQALKEGQIRYCESLGFSPQELCELTRLTADDILFLSNSAVQFITTRIDHEMLGRMLARMEQERLFQQRLEEALSLGASGWQTFWYVPLPNIKWGLLYGVLLCNARAMGEFGAVSVVSGRIRGLTNTMPLHVEILYNEYNMVAAFAVASPLALLALVTLALKTFLELRFGAGAAGGRH